MKKYRDVITKNSCYYHNWKVPKKFNLHSHMEQINYTYPHIFSTILVNSYAFRVTKSIYKMC